MYNLLEVPRGQNFTANHKQRFSAMLVKYLYARGALMTSVKLNIESIGGSHLHQLGLQINCPNLCLNTYDVRWHRKLVFVGVTLHPPPLIIPLCTIMMKIQFPTAARLRT